MAYTNLPKVTFVRFGELVNDDESIEVSDAQGEFLDEETFNKIVENAKNVGLITEDKYEDIHYKWRRKGKPHFSIMFEFTEEDNGK